ncbi:MAG TPA: hypothetical protein VK656_06455 [Candidatus Acidoferrum sp.]|nr:hypothetical protein [Candidatus Acidoferrum sp.]
MRTPQSGRRLGPVGILVALVAGACSSVSPSAQPSPSASDPGSGPTRIPLLIDQQDYVGQTRFLFGMLDGGTSSIGSPTLPVKVAFYEVAKSSTTPVGTFDSTFIWAIQDVKGVYVVNTTFKDAGDWIAEFTSTANGLTEKTRVQFQVSATSTTPIVGGKAPDTVTPTLADVDGVLKALSTDTDPNPDFYKVSVHDALAQHKPFVLVFATPAFCQTKQCGPTLDSVKAVAATESGMTFINVEPYKMTFANNSLQPVLDAQGSLQATDVTNAWGLLTEPWIFVVDKAGIVRGSYSLIVSADELKAAIDAVK